MTKLKDVIILLLVFSVSVTAQKEIDYFRTYLDFNIGWQDVSFWECDNCKYKWSTLDGAFLLPD